MRGSIRLVAGTGMLALFVSGGSCATRTTVTRRVVSPPTAASTWNGRSAEDVEKAWGAPAESQADGEGGTVLVFRRDTSFSFSASEGTSIPDTPPTVTDPNRVESGKVTKDVARFWIDAGGTVYRYWFAQEVYDAERDQPPAREAIE